MLRERDLEGIKMINSMKQIIEYLSEYASDPVPKFILLKEICKESVSSPCYINSYAGIKESKWYHQLAVEQMENGSWGRFHTQDTKEKTKRKFVTTEQALRRARELSLDKDDVLISKSIMLMERYLRDEENWTDTNEKHYGFEISFKALITANLSLFDPYNPLINSRRDICAKNISRAFSTGYFQEEIWEQENLRDNEILLRAYMVYPLWLLQNVKCMGDTVQRQYLNYIWNREKGIYYISSCPPSRVQFLESKEFTMWLSCLENLSGFSLFPEFMNGQIVSHLYGEINRLIYEEVVLPPAHPISGHYSESWSSKNARKNDMILRIARILAKC